MPQNMRTCGTLLALAGVVLLLGAAALDGAAAGQRDAQPADGGAEKVGDRADIRSAPLFPYALG